jgi:hypothetical protein
MQVCLNCGSERESKVRFGGPHYRRTQEGIPNFVPSPLSLEEELDRLEVIEFPSMAA